MKTGKSLVWDVPQNASFLFMQSSGRNLTQLRQLPTQVLEQQGEAPQSLHYTLAGGGDSRRPGLVRVNRLTGSSQG